MVLCCGTITLDMKVNSKMGKWKEKELKPGLMETDMKACGPTIYNMVLDCSIMLKQIKRLQKSGEREKDGHGIRPLSLSQVLLPDKHKVGKIESHFTLTINLSIS